MKGASTGPFVEDEAMEPMEITPASRIIILGGCHPDQPVAKFDRIFDIPLGA